MDLPIAGPQRAERMAWTGDNQLITPMSCRTMFDTFRFFGKWLEDVRFDQSADGQIGTRIPYVTFSKEAEKSVENPSVSAAWGDAAVIVPFELYSFYGDPAILENYIDMARRYVDFMRDSGDDELTFTQGFSFGDWFALDDGEDAYPGKTDKTLIACFYYCYSSYLLSRMLCFAGRLAQAEEYEALSNRIRAELRRRYFDGYGRLTLPTQTSCAMALQFGIAGHPETVCAQMAGLIRQAGRLETGFIGTSMILQALCRYGYAGLAYDLFLRRGIRPGFTASVSGQLRFGNTGTAGSRTGACGSQT
jgi:alpha-L-rhamnosidase